MDSELSGSSSNGWILAFDDDCCHCRDIAERVQQAAGSALEILSLRDPHVASWRTQALGEKAPWTPTLLHVTSRRVKAWVGIGMVARLARLMGPRSALRLLGELGEMRKAVEAPQEAADLAGIKRGQFLKFAGVGVVAAIVGTRIDLASVPPPNPAREWVRTHRDTLPRTYPEFSAHTMEYRKAIYANLPPEARQQLWQDHFQNYRQTHDRLTAEQQRVIDQAIEVIQGDVVNPPLSAQSHAALDALSSAAIAAFGKDEARRLLATLGPDEPRAEPLAQCECATRSVWWCSNGCRGCYPCPSGSYCSTAGCTCVESNCGTALAYTCDGKCY
ncbi:bacteriocin fulvocin C-related protein [Nonomuraea sp. NPDC046802]|uniref:bacteriocin fulvocin C-related protein n=1 Tax=Nonomuraea sp. NPDC046802 TaxID=3154919 RepID=UPI00340E0849